MIITRESDYAIRIIRAISDGEKMTVSQICKRESIPKPFAYKILKKLTKAGIVSSVRGALGGYCLKENLNSINLYDIIICIDKEFVVNECMAEDYECINNKGNKLCAVHEELKRIQTMVENEFKRKSMGEILESN